MLANILVKPGVLELNEIKTPEPSRGEILVSIKASLTCGTDLKAFMRGHQLIPLPAVFGHEFSGIIEKVGKGVKKFSEGMEVMAVHSAPCGKCYFCSKGLHNLCEGIMKMKILGAFAEYILLPEHITRYNMFKKPTNLSFAEAAFLEPLSCVVHSINSVKLSKGDNAVVVGAGAIGLLHLMVLRMMGIKVIVIEQQKERLQKAIKEKANMVIDPNKEDANKKIKAFTKGIGADIAFECTGNPDVWENSIYLVRRGGTVILFGGCKEGTQVTYDAGRIHYDEITLKGVFHYNLEDVKKAYTLLKNGKIKVSGLISGSYPLKDLKKAFQKLMKGEGIKYAIIP